MTIRTYHLIVFNVIGAFIALLLIFLLEKALGKRLEWMH